MRNIRILYLRWLQKRFLQSSPSCIRLLLRIFTFFIKDSVATGFYLIFFSQISGLWQIIWWQKNLLETVHQPVILNLHQTWPWKKCKCWFFEGKEFFKVPCFSAVGETTSPETVYLTNSIHKSCCVCYYFIVILCINVQFIDFSHRTFALAVGVQ